MLFNSLSFLAFLVGVYALYIILRRRYVAQNRMLLVASYLFYSFWDWRFLALLATTTTIDFLVGRALHNTDAPGRRKLLLATSIAANLSILGFFKYFNFFADSFSHLLELLGMHPDFATLNIILPVGISFYTFQSISYTVDIYRRKIKPVRNFFDYALFVSFFPQLVAGPIERAANLLPQVTAPRKLVAAQINAGLFLILWGYFKKVVVADNVAMIADTVFNDHTSFEGLDLTLAALAFTVQIYCDFSAYSDIARGVCKLLGFELMVNFRLPYFALNPSDFWRRWHISLSSWLRDYLYVSLGGNRKSAMMTYRNLMLTMLLGGLWHGAAWNFVVWGAFHGGILIAYRAFDRNPQHDDPWSGRYSRWRVLGKMALMFVLTVIGWIIFRSQSLEQIGYIFSHIGVIPGPGSLDLAYKLTFFSLPLLVVQLYQYTTRDLLIITKLSVWARMVIYAFFLIWILIFGVRESIEFIYFQF
ncbi:MAG: MBOAT family O-acyltransferase [Gammaproteobacteria bacterium]